MNRIRENTSYLRNFVFGVEDSLVSTVGLLSGIAVTGMSAHSIFVTGMILIFVEAFSMAAGSFLSESSADEFETHTETVTMRSLRASVVMFISYFLSGFIPLAPYVLFAPLTALWVSIVFSVIALGVLGVVGARLSKVSMTHSALRMMVIGGLAIGAGVAVGLLVQGF